MEAAQAPLPASSIALSLAGVSAVAFLALALITSTRRSRTPLALDVALMCVAMSAYNIFEVAYSLTVNARWAWIEYATASSSAVPTLRMFVGYVGKQRRYRAPMRIATSYFLLLAASCLVPFVRPSWTLYPGGPFWALLMLVGILPAFGGAGFLMWRHAARSNRDERARVRLLAGSLLLGVGGISTDLLAMVGGTLPRLAAPGLVISCGLVAALMLRARFFEQMRVVTLVNAAVAAIIAVVAQLAIVTLVGGSTALLTLGTIAVAMTLVAAVRPLWATLTEERARLEESATLGRFAQQMAHDVRNPLAAIHGAAQFLLEEQDQGRPLEPHRAFIELILERAERLERVIADYQRMGRVEAQPSEADVNVLVKEALQSHQVSADEGVRFSFELADALPKCSLDHDLFVHAVENVVRNALEAMEGSGCVSVKTTASGDVVLIRLTDDGPGMDPRTAERAFDAFYTNKASGTGLGLSFVARVMEAHGGTARLETQMDKGTVVELEIPVDTAA